MKDAAWPRSDVDRFLLAAMEAKGLKPVRDADRRALLRRVTFDLTGLPPTPEGVGAFVADTSADAYEKVVDRLLASTRFGERWGRHWLDVARFAESSGKDTNIAYPHAWRYRDYVIAAFNADKPYDQFIREQLAGDLLPAKDNRQRAEQFVATGFLAIGPKGHNTRDRLQFELDLADEQVDAVTQSFMGLTVACARCHDHKFDPIPQRDYYALAGIFRSTETCFGTVRIVINQNPARLLELPRVPVGDGPAMVSLPGRLVRPDLLQLQLNNLQQTQTQLVQEQQRRRLAGESDSDLTRRFIGLRTQMATLQAALGEVDQYGEPRLWAMGAWEGRPGDSPLYVRGEAARPGEVVPRGFLQVMDSVTSEGISSGSGRKELADWIASPRNPLTARVLVNRVWHYLFGRGLVPSTDNFGAMGQRPSHPELLDYLATYFVGGVGSEVLGVRNGSPNTQHPTPNTPWSIKRLIREIVLTRAYRLSAEHSRTAYAVDPDNVYRWRMSPRRLEGEALRDAMLAVSGRLDPEPPVGSGMSRQGDGVAGQAVFRSSFESASGMRSVYLPVIRDNVVEPLAVFDFAHPGQVTGVRETTSTATQALYLMNSPIVQGLADAFARRLAATANDPQGRIRMAYVLAFGRPPTAAEVRASEDFFRTFPAGEGRGPGVALSTFCQALFQSAEFRHLE